VIAGQSSKQAPDRFSVHALEIKHAESGVKQNGLVVLIQGNTLADSERFLGAMMNVDFRRLPKALDPIVHQAYLDYEEIDGLIKAIDYLSSVDPKASEYEHLEATYTTNGEFRVKVSCNSVESDLRVTVDFSAEDLPSGHFSLSELEECKKLLVKGKERIDTLNAKAAKR
jgi:hypothetical protein